MTLHLVITFKLKTVIHHTDKDSERQLRRSEAGGYPTVTLLRLRAPAPTPCI